MHHMQMCVLLRHSTLIKRRVQKESLMNLVQNFKPGIIYGSALVCCAVIVISTTFILKNFRMNFFFQKMEKKLIILRIRTITSYEDYEIRCFIIRQYIFYFFFFSSRFQRRALFLYFRDIVFISFSLSFISHNVHRVCKCTPGIT